MNEFAPDVSCYAAAGCWMEKASTSCVMPFLYGYFLFPRYEVDE